MKAQKKTQDTGGKVGANEFDDTMASELDGEDQSTLRGETVLQQYRPPTLKVCLTFYMYIIHHLSFSISL